MEPPPRYSVTLGNTPLSRFNLVVIEGNVVLRRDHNRFWNFESHGAQGYRIRPPRTDMVVLSLAPVTDDIPPVEWANAMLHPFIRGESQQWRIVGMPGIPKYVTLPRFYN